MLDDGIGYVRDGDVVFSDPGQGTLAVPARHERDAIDAAERADDGVGLACDQIEAFLQSGRCASGL